MRFLFGFPWLRCLCLGLTLVVASAGAVLAASQAESVVAEVEGGLIRGTTADDLVVFKGIPFARPPIGPLRWRAPQSVTPWQGVLDASEFRPDCVQLPVKGTSEDCLYLNVWRPAAPPQVPLAVMVWIYGGGLVRGGASIYPAGELARQGIVVVTFNYRVGRLGFFAYPGLAAEDPGAPRGNYGYMDQLAALQWVHRNIAALGGDPNRVTIAGESAGAGSVLVMLTSPLARGLFHRAILESAGMPAARAGVMPMRDLATAERMAIEYAAALGIKSEGKEALAALRGVSAERLAENTEVARAAVAGYGGPDIPGMSSSIIDGRLVVEAPETALLAGRQVMVPVIAGGNSYDLAWISAHTKDALFALFGPLAPEARALYDPRGEAGLEALIQDVIADRVMLEPSRHLAELITRAGQAAYFYRFSYVAESLRSNTRGALHAAEVMYAFDTPAAVLKVKATAADIAMGRTVSGYWVSFVKTGNPNGGGRPQWPRHDLGGRGVLNFTNRGAEYGPDPVATRLDLWRDVWQPQVVPAQSLASKRP